jgi:PhzF family phenazine biosynthesis protein
MQSIAAENNLAETAFFVRHGDRYGLRWFTPAVEVDLCGHATVASAAVIFERLSPSDSELRFDSKSGELIVRREGKLYVLDFPSIPAKESPEIHPKLLPSLGIEPEAVLRSRNYLVVYQSEAQIRALKPDMAGLAAIDDAFAVIVTAPGDRSDFVSRFFAPAKGVPEDPVTGSAHCTLTPYWAKRLGKSSLHAYQLSPRGGELWCEDRGPRVRIAGHAVCFLEGTITISTDQAAAPAR